MAKGTGKPCGASHIAQSRVCRVNMPSAVARALDAVTGEVGAKTLKEAVNKHVGPRGVSRLREIRAEIRNEMGGNVVKGPKADELKRRLQAEGLLPNGKAKSVAPDTEPGLNTRIAKVNEKIQKIREERWAPKQRDRSVPPDLKAKLAALDAGVKAAKERGRKQGEEDAGKLFQQQVAKPDSKYGKWGDGQLQGQLKAAKNLGKKDVADRIAKELKRRGVPEENKSEPRPKGMEKYDLDIQKSIDKDVEANTTFRGGKAGYDWKDSLSSDAKVLGAGMYGTAILGKNGDVVKRGEIGRDETAIIEKVGKLGIGPKLISVELDGPGIYDARNAKGRLAMSEVKGTPVGYRKPDDEVNGVKVADAYWTARAQLHRAGIAHNDMHIDNVLIDNKGRGRFVDMGMAQDNPKAALAEAMGAFVPPRGGMVTRPMGVKGQGDWQVRRYEGTGGRLMEAAQRSGDYKEIMQKAPVAARVLDNKNALQFRMQKDGFSKDDIATIMDHGLRNELSTYDQGVWGKVSNQQALEYIGILYDGI